MFGLDLRPLLHLNLENHLQRHLGRLLPKPDRMSNGLLGAMGLEIMVRIGYMHNAAHPQIPGPCRAKKAASTVEQWAFVSGSTGPGLHMALDRLGESEPFVFCVPLLSPHC